MANDTMILGVSMSHDAGAVLLKNGKILAAVNEERLARKKLIAGVPAKALAAVFEIARANPAEVGAVAVANRSHQGRPPIKNDMTDEQGRRPFNLKLVEFIDRWPLMPALMKSDLGVRLYQAAMPLIFRSGVAELRAVLKSLGVCAPIKFYDHHDAHIAAAYFSSGIDNCLVISNDGFGDGLCSKAAVCRDGKIKTVSRNSFYNSLGQYYNYVTHFCGFAKIHHAGKVTGLAAHGIAEKTAAWFRQIIPWDEEKGRYINRGPLFTRGLRLVSKTFQGFNREDLAAGVQRHTEEVLAQMARHYLEKYQLTKLCLTGGVHANVRANQVIAETTQAERVFVYPHMGDGGLAMGAAFLALAEKNKSFLPAELQHVYLGPVYPEAVLAEELARRKIVFSRPDDIAKAAAERLAQGKIIARFDGRMEYGPRALGNRSILYQATDPKVNDWLNKQLKRTEFMPFAPVVREKDASLYFQNYREATARTAEFMTITYQVTDRCRNEAPAIVHLDGTARPQVIRKEINPGYYKILDEYHRLTGLSVLVNTSFNLHEEPIVCAPEEAIRSFYQSNLDSLVIGPFLVDNDKKNDH